MNPISETTLISYSTVAFFAGIVIGICCGMSFRNWIIKDLRCALSVVSNGLEYWRKRALAHEECVRLATGLDKVSSISRDGGTGGPPVRFR